MRRMKIAIVNQRYGMEVNGGSEYHARILAEQLSNRADVEVITTCARDYDTWENFYEEGESTLHGVLVRRFPVERQRNLKRFKLIDRIRKYSPLFPRCLEEKWVKQQGPYAPKAIAYIREQAESYDCFIFVTYLYYLTVKGLKYVADKSILIPTAHDEPFLKMSIYQELFRMPKGYFFNTQEERELVYHKFKTRSVPCEIGGVGIEVPEHPDGEGFRKKYGLGQYILYVGRIDYGKNCHILFDFFEKYKKNNAKDVKLVMMGKENIKVPQREDILSLGFVDEKEKYDGMKGAALLILPSEYESMSIVVLDSMKLGVPVVVNGKCTVLRAHCEKSGGGLYYTDYEGFEAAVNELLCDEKKRMAMGEKGKQYVDENYRWDSILGRLEDLIERCLKTEEN